MGLVLESGPSLESLLPPFSGFLFCCAVSFHMHFMRRCSGQRDLRRPSILDFQNGKLNKPSQVPNLRHFVVTVGNREVTRPVLHEVDIGVTVDSPEVDPEVRILVQVTYGQVLSGGGGRKAGQGSAVQHRRLKPKHAYVPGGHELQSSPVGRSAHTLHRSLAS